MTTFSEYVKKPQYFIERRTVEIYVLHEQHPFIPVVSTRSLTPEFLMKYEIANREFSETQEVLSDIVMKREQSMYEKSIVSQAESLGYTLTKDNK